MGFKDHDYNQERIATGERRNQIGSESGKLQLKMDS